MSDDESLFVGLKRRLRTYPALYRPARTAWHWIRNIANVSLRLQRRRDRTPHKPLKPAKRRREIALWRQAGRPVPPPHAFKQVTVATYARAFRLTRLVETGTYLGDMVDAQRLRFRQILSIELSPELCRSAQARFAHAKNVTVLQGDSGDMMESIAARLEGPALFWLDGHYSGGLTVRGHLDTPVQRELAAILGSVKDHVILVDDARCFGTGDYPTLDEVRALVAKRRPGWTCVVEDDIIRIHPPAVLRPTGGQPERGSAAP